MKTVTSGDESVKKVILAYFVSGAILALALWGICHVFLGYVPKVFGISRPWIDVPLLGICIIMVLVFVGGCADEYDRFCDKEESPSIWRFMKRYPILVLMGLVLATVITIFFTPLAMIVATVFFLGFCVTKAGSFLKAKTLLLSWLLATTASLLAIGIFCNGKR